MYNKEQQNTSSTWTILWKTIDGTPTENSLKYLKRTIILKENINAHKEFCSTLKRLQQNLPRKKILPIFYKVIKQKNVFNVLSG